MDLVVVLAAVALPAVAAWGFLVLLMARAAAERRPAPEGAVRPWEAEEEERTRTKRLNAIIEQEFFHRAA